MEDVSALLARARALDAQGRNEDARRAYLELLAANPEHFEALGLLGNLLVKLGHRAAARAAFAQAARVRPGSASAHANLATLLCDDDTAGAIEHYEIALRLEPDHRSAHCGLAILLLRTGRLDAAREHGRAGGMGAAVAWPYRGAEPPVSLLVVVSAIGGNVPFDAFLDDRVFRKWTLAPELFDPDGALPPHDLVFNTIGDADLCGPSLDAAAAVLSRTNAPVLNRPERVRPTGRAANAERLRSVPGVVTAHTREWSREALEAPGAADALRRDGFEWPLLLRSPGFHTGEQFVKVDEPSALPGAVAGLPGPTLLVLQYVDTRGPDGMFRKYRAMFVDGQLYPLHLAVSPRWKVHYFSADMAERPDHRAADEAFLKDMPGTVGEQAMQTLEAIRAALGLDYGGMDFGLRDGHVVLFEANATMVIVQPPDDPRWAYRVAPVERVKQAVQRMLLRAAGRLDRVPTL